MKSVNPVAPGGREGEARAPCRCKLAIELDGGQHALREAEDAARSDEIAPRGYRLIRFWNGEVMDNLAGVLETIRRELDSR